MACFSRLFVRYRARPEGFAGFAEAAPCYQAAPLLWNITHRPFMLLTQGCECTAAQASYKTAAETRPPWGCSRMFCCSSCLKNYLLHGVTQLQHILEQNHQTTHSLLFSFPRSLLCPHLCNKIQCCPMMHFLPWPTFAPAASCGRASRPVCRFYLGWAMRISNRDSHRHSLEKMFHFISCQQEKGCEVFPSPQWFTYPWLSDIKHLCSESLLSNPSNPRGFLPFPWLSFNITWCEAHRNAL